MLERFGPFPLVHYWGPAAGLLSSQWIAWAATYLMEHAKPDLLLARLPHLTYNSQRFGPRTQQVQEDVQAVDTLVGELAEHVSASRNTDVLIFSEYIFSAVSQAVSPNHLLREAGLLFVRRIEGKVYIDLELSEAFAIVDHQIAHIYCQKRATKAVLEILTGEPGIEEVLLWEELGPFGLDHPRSGDLVSVSRRDHWFAYYWWPVERPELAPHFAHQVNSSRKPGYDPLELCWDPEAPGVPTRPQLIRGSHGHPGQCSFAILPSSMAPAQWCPFSIAALGQVILVFN